MTEPRPERFAPNEEHRLIVEATIDGNVDLAKERLIAQYLKTLRLLEEQIESESSGS